LSGFICSTVEAGLLGTDTIIDDSEFVGGAQGVETLGDTSMIGVS
jgi:hypothetical protein